MSGLFSMGGFMGAAGAYGQRGTFPTRFEEQYHCYPVSFQDKEHMEDGDKILLPSSALDTLARLHVEYPMLFEISNPSEGKTTHCGVLEFSATEGSCYIPFWMMQNLLLEAGGLITIKNVSLPKATYVKFQAQSVDFLDISNHRAVLERQLRHFSCVTKGDQICIPYNNRKYYLEIREVKPANAACIIETDCNVDFEEPIGWQEHVKKLNAAKAAESSSGSAVANGHPAASGGASGGLNVPAPVSGKAAPVEDNTPKFVPFTGGGARLDGKATPTLTAEEANAARLAAAERRASSSSTGSSSTATAAEPAKPKVVPGVAPPPVRKGKPLATQFAKRKLQTGAFSGSGNSMA